MKTKQKRYKVIVDDRLCKRCGICVYICPKHIFFLSNKLTVKSAGCSGCGQCEMMCPDLALNIIEIK